MKLHATIHNQRYDVVQGATFSEEYNETLDGGTIIIDQVPRIENLRPYDDVRIDDEDGGFHKHLLVDQYSEEPLRKGGEVLYKYKITLFSETKGLEVAILPNVCVTHSGGANLTIYEVAKAWVGMYSPKVKVVTSGDGWALKDKFSLGDDVDSTFGSAECPEFSMNTPTLKDALAQLFIVRDCIPYVTDGVIHCLDISKRVGEFSIEDSERTMEVASMSSANYADELVRPYQNAISQDGSTRRVEMLGFRNSDEGLLTIDNMRLETTYPIYRINRVLMCYYKKVTIVDLNGEDSERVMLVKQDITPLVLLNSQRNLLSQDWDDFNESTPSTISGMSKYKMCTVGYDVGSRYITGWGAKYTYPTAFWDTTKTYIENIAEKVDGNNPVGLYSTAFLTAIRQGMSAQYGSIPADLVSPWSDKGHSLWLKSFLFEVDYNAMYSGMVKTSKDGLGGNGVSMQDNSASSLSILEQDGVFLREKANRFGNRAVQINARYADISRLQALGSVYEDDEICYHREYAVYDKVVQCAYYLTKDYVLRNYFTSVRSQIRPFNFLDYSSSVRRAENIREIVFLSKDKKYYAPDDRVTIAHPSELLSALRPTPEPEAVGYEKQPDAINYLVVNGYASDVNKFVCGNSLCVEFSMPDNISYGEHIKKATPEYKEFGGDEYIGSTQGWYDAVGDDGRLEGVELIAHALPEADTYKDVFDGESGCNSYYENTLFKLPKAPDFTTSERKWRLATKTGTYSLAVTDSSIWGDKVQEHTATKSEPLAALIPNLKLTGVSVSVAGVDDHYATDYVSVISYSYEKGKFSVTYQTQAGVSADSVTFTFNTSYTALESYSVDTTPETKKFEVSLPDYVKDNKEILDITIQFEYLCDDGIMVSPYFPRLCDWVGYERKNAYTYDKVDPSQGQGLIVLANCSALTGDYQAKTTSDIPFLMIQMPTETYGNILSFVDGTIVGSVSWGSKNFNRDDWGGVLNAGRKGFIWLELSNIKITSATGDTIVISAHREAIVTEGHLFYTKDINVSDDVSYTLRKVNGVKENQVWSTAKAEGVEWFILIAESAIDASDGFANLAGINSVPTTTNLIDNGGQWAREAKARGGIECTHATWTDNPVALPSNLSNGYVTTITTETGEKTSHFERNMFVDWCEEALSPDAPFDDRSRSRPIATTRADTTFAVDDDGGVTISLPSTQGWDEGRTLRSVRLYYGDRFVFGVDCSAGDFEGGSMRIAYSVLADKGLAVFNADGSEAGEVRNEFSEEPSSTRRWKGV